MNTVTELFNLVLSSVCQKKRKNKNFDGKAYWQPIKQILEKSNWEAEKWKKPIKSIYQANMALPEYYIDGHGEKHINEYNHFLIKTVVIPSTEKPSLKKIIQVALNIGQYLSAHSENFKNIKVNYNDYILSKDACKKLDTILDTKYLEELKKIIL